MDIASQSAELIAGYGRMGLITESDDLRLLQEAAARVSSNMFPANVADKDQLLAAVYILGEWLDTDCEL